MSKSRFSLLTDSSEQKTTNSNNRRLLSTTSLTLILQNKDIANKISSFFPNENENKKNKDYRKLHHIFPYTEKKIAKKEYTGYIALRSTSRSYYDGFSVGYKYIWPRKAWDKTSIFACINYCCTTKDLDEYSASQPLQGSGSRGCYYPYGWTASGLEGSDYYRTSWENDNISYCVFLPCTYRNGANYNCYVICCCVSLPIGIAECLTYRGVSAACCFFAGSVKDACRDPGIQMLTPTEARKLKTEAPRTQKIV